LGEETGLVADDPRPLVAVDLIGSDDLPDDHHLMIAVRLTWRGGEPRPGDDALEARWVSPAHLPRPLCPDVARVIARALAPAG
jgi:ADP-ribose pyrophosphatase YjhB (NUDIX family)